MSKIKDKEMEYPDAPSGFVTLYNYKEPFMAFKEGYGFEGTLIFDGETDKIQCHFCGDWFESLPPHLGKEHNMRADAYKEAVGLSKSTALINEKVRAKLIATGHKKRLLNLRPGTGHTAESKAKISATLKANVRELQNLRGTCPEQLIHRLQKQYEELGRTPTERELTFQDTLIRVYGSMERACMIAGIPYRKPGQVVNKYVKWTREECINQVRKFFIDNKRLPRFKDYKNRKGTWAAFDRYGRREIFKLAVRGDGQYRKTETSFNYSDEDLLTFLKTFREMHGRIPSYSDSKRGLLPSLSIYRYHFGGWQNALKRAFTDESSYSYRVKELA